MKQPLLILTTMSMVGCGYPYVEPSHMTTATYEKPEFMKNLDKAKEYADEATAKFRKHLVEWNAMPEGPEKEARAQALKQEEQITKELVAQYNAYYQRAGQILDRESRFINESIEANAIQDMGTAALLNSMSTPPPTRVEVHYSPY
jgi:hypothetical protein